jgi:hypothetical protein
LRKLLILLLFGLPCAAATDPCTLLTKAEVLAVQGEAFTDASKNVHTAGDVTVAQCFYGLSDASRSSSVVLELTTAPHLREMWEKQFEPGEAEAEGERHAIEVKGLGRNAFWGGNRVSGALYVLAPHAILRVSIGGRGDPASKLERAKKLAKMAMAKMK